MAQNNNEETKAQGTTTASQGTAKKATKKEKPAKTPKAKKEKPARTTPAHMSKVDKVAAQLPPLSEESQVLFAAANNMSTADMNGLVAHLNIEIRRRGVRAISQGTVAAKLEVGQRVQIKSGHPRFTGQQGTVSRIQRIRCYVRLDGRDKDDYFFINDVQPLTGSSAGDLQAVFKRLTSTPAQVDINMIEDEEETAGDKSATG